MVICPVTARVPLGPASSAKVPLPEMVEPLTVKEKSVEEPAVPKSRDHVPRKASAITFGSERSTEFEHAVTMLSAITANN